MLIVCIWHFDRGLGVMWHGYLAVDFFFILSGFFLYFSATKPQAKRTLDYTLDKVIRYYPETLIVLFPLLIVSWPRALEEPQRLLNDLFFVTSSSVFGGGWNAPLWFLHIMLLAGAILYPLVKNWRRVTITVLLPCLFLFGMTFLLNRDGGRLETGGIAGPFDCSLLRGLSEMSFGILVAAFWQMKSCAITENIAGRTCVNILSWICLAAILALLFIKPVYDRYILIFSPIVIVACYDANTALNRMFKSAVWDYLGGVSFEMYLVHFGIMKVFVRFLGRGYDGELFAVYLVAVFAASLLLRWVYTKVLKMKPAR